MRSNRLPVRYLEDGLLLSADAAWAWFRIPTVSYELLSDEQREGLLNGATSALAALRVGECHLLAVPRANRVGEWAARLDDDTARPAPGWPRYLRQQAEYLAGMAFWSKEVYLGVALGRRGGGGMSWFRRVERAGGLEDHVVPERELDSWRTKASSVARLLAAGALHAEPAAGDDLRWLIQRCFHRGLADPVPSPATGNRRWGAGQLEALAEGTLYNGHRSIRVEQAAGTGHVAFLAAAEFPDVLRFPGAEWLYLYDVLGFPVEASVRFRLVPPREAAAHASKKLAEAGDQARNIVGTSSDLPIALLEAASQARELEYALSKDSTPLVYGSPRFAVAAATAEELEGNVDLIVDAYRDMGIELVRPTGDQLSLFLEALPGGRGRLKAYEQRQALVTLAGGMPMATSDLGDQHGPYIGRTTGRTRGPVHFDPLAAAMRDEPTAIAITGQPGAGKTNLAELLLYQMALRGAWTLLVDPKGEAGRLTKLDGLGTTRLLELGPQHAGLLDPFQLVDDSKDAAPLAASVCQLLLPGRLNYEQNAILLAACAEEASASRASLHGVIHRLARDQRADAPALASTLQVTSTMPLARLCFASGDAATQRADANLTVVQIPGLVVPEPETPMDDYTLADRLSVAVMYLVAHLARRLSMVSPGQAKAIVLDEAWMITATQQGRTLVPALARMGRSRNTAVICVSQSASDFLGAQLQNNFSTKFAFRSTYEDEVTRVLRLLGLQPTREHIGVVRGLRNGECIFADLDGRIGTVAIDLVLPELRRAFDTTPPRLRRVTEPA